MCHLRPNVNEEGSSTQHLEELWWGCFGRPFHKQTDLLQVLCNKTHVYKRRLKWGYFEEVNIAYVEWCDITRLQIVHLANNSIKVVSVSPNDVFFFFCKEAKGDYSR